jgi:hypothetical protein
MVEVPWARPQSGFTLLFQGLYDSTGRKRNARGGRVKDGEGNGSAHLAQV